MEEDRKCELEQFAGSIGQMDLKTSENIQVKQEDGTFKIDIKTTAKPPVCFSISYNLKIEDQEESKLNTCEFCSFRGLTSKALICHTRTKHTGSRFLNASSVFLKPVLEKVCPNTGIESITVSQ